MFTFVISAYCYTSSWVSMCLCLNPKLSFTKSYPWLYELSLCPNLAKTIPSEKLYPCLHRKPRVIPMCSREVNNGVKTVLFVRPCNIEEVSSALSNGERLWLVRCPPQRRTSRWLLLRGDLPTLRARSQVAARNVSVSCERMRIFDIMSVLLVVNLYYVGCVLLEIFLSIVISHDTTSNFTPYTMHQTWDYTCTYTGSNTGGDHKQLSEFINIFQNSKGISEEKKNRYAGH